MIPKSIAEKAARFSEVHSIPPVLAAILAEIDNDEQSIGSLARIISSDIAMSAKLLRTANSAFYRRTEEISTIPDAIRQLGTRAVKALALSVSIFDIANDMKLSRHIDLRDFWRHNLEVAIIGAELTCGDPRINAEEVFACGLLHDLGILFLLETFPDEYAAVLQNNRAGNLLEMERKIFETDHCQVGSLLSKNWRLPGIFAESIGRHHDDNPGETGSNSPETWQFVSLAHRFASNWIDSDDFESAAGARIKNKFIEQLKIPYPEAGFIADSKNRALTMAGYLDIDIGDPWLLLGKINRELSRIYQAYEKLIIENEQLKVRLESLESGRSSSKDESAFMIIRDLLLNLQKTIQENISVVQNHTEDTMLSGQFAMILGRLESITSSIAEICVSEDSTAENPQPSMQRPAENIAIGKG